MFAQPILSVILAVLLSSAAAGAFNQYVERDVDCKMARTRKRPFVTGALRHGPGWLWLIGGLTAASVLAASFAANAVAALYVFLGAFTYAVVYTVWLKRRTWWNIVVGGLAGSFAVLAATACHPGPVLTPKTAGVGGTIAGIVSTEGNAAVPGRKVTAINVATGMRYEATTGANGGYTIQVPEGNYRLDVELRAGEMVIKQPPETKIDRSDLDPQLHFTIR